MHTGEPAVCETLNISCVISSGKAPLIGSCTNYDLETFTVRFWQCDRRKACTEMWGFLYIQSPSFPEARIWINRNSISNYDNWVQWQCVEWCHRNDNMEPISINFKYSLCIFFCRRCALAHDKPVGLQRKTSLELVHATMYMYVLSFEWIFVHWNDNYPTWNMTNVPQTSKTGANNGMCRYI